MGELEVGRVSKKRRKPSAQVADAAPMDIGYALDAFQNMLARMGVGSSQLMESTAYPMTRLTRDWSLMNSLYRSHWIVQRIIDVVPNDMTKNWYQLSTELNPDLVKRYTQQEMRTQVRAKINTALKWARLYGGAGALIIIAGHGDQMDQPLDLDRVMPGSFKGLMVLDRWMGVTPSQELVRDFDDPEFGLPVWYRVTIQGGDTIPVHHSRILRFTGREMPPLEQAMEQYWGTSEIEAVFEELKKRDNSSWAIASLIFRANLLFFKQGDMGQQIASTNVRAQQSLYTVMSAINRMMSSNGMTMLGKDDDVMNFQYAFAGLPEVYDRFMMDISGATGIPVTRLFGRSPAGMNATGESDMQLYYSMLEEQLESRLYPALTKLLPIMAMSCWGAVPDDLDIQFNSVYTLGPKDKLEMAKGQAEMISSISNASLISDQVALKELKRFGDPLGLWVSITDEDIEQADSQPPLNGEDPDGLPELPFGLGLDVWNEKDHEQNQIDESPVDPLRKPVQK